MKYVDFVRTTFGSPDFPVFTLRDLRIALSDRGISDGYLRLLAHELLRRNEITRITRGVYTFHDEAFVSGFAFKPFYYGLGCALSIRGLSTQMTNPIVVTTRDVRVGVRRFQGRNYVIRRMDGRYFFGYDLVRYGKFWVPVSDVEKTVIDMVYFGYGIGDELLEDIRKSIDMKRLGVYLKRYDKGVGSRVMAELGGERAWNGIKKR